MMISNYQTISMLKLEEIFQRKTMQNYIEIFVLMKKKAWRKIQS